MTYSSLHGSRLMVPMSRFDCNACTTTFSRAASRKAHWSSIIITTHEYIQEHAAPKNDRKAHAFSVYPSSSGAQYVPRSMQIVQNSFSPAFIKHALSSMWSAHPAAPPPPLSRESPPAHPCSRTLLSISARLCLKQSSRRWHRRSRHFRLSGPALHALLSLLAILVVRPYSRARRPRRQSGRRGRAVHAR